MFHQMFLSAKLKRWAIISYKHGIYNLPHVLKNELRLRSKEIRKHQESICISGNEILVPSLPAKTKLLLILAENSSKSEIELFQLCAISHQKRVSLTHFMSYCLWKICFDYELVQT